MSIKIPTKNGKTNPAIINNPKFDYPNSSWITDIEYRYYTLKKVTPLYIQMLPLLVIFIF